MGPLRISMPCHPPPLIHYTPQSLSPVSEPFVLCFITGNISVCYSCWQRYPKPCEPPHDLCVRHKEWREFFPPGSGTDLAMCTTIVMCHAFKQGVRFSPMTCFRSQHLLQPNFSQFTPNTWLFICAILWKVMCRVYTVYSYVLLVVLNDTRIQL